MNSIQIIDSINAGIYAKNIVYATPFSKGAYIAFIAQWKETYKKLSKAIRAEKRLLKDWQRPTPRNTEAEEKVLLADAAFKLPEQIGFVQLSAPQMPAWYPAPQRLAEYAKMLLVLRKQMKLEAAKLRELVKS